MKLFGRSWRRGLISLALMALVMEFSGCPDTHFYYPDAGPMLQPDVGHTEPDANPWVDAGEMPDAGFSLCSTPCVAPLTCVVVNDIAQCGCDPDAGLAEMNGTCVQNTCLPPNGCDTHASCSLYADAGHACICDKPQYFGDGTTCSYDYCYNPNPPVGGSSSNGTCPANSTCANGPDGGICNCDPGFAISSDGTQCLSETCLGLPDGGVGCPVHSTCMAEPNQGQCVCNADYALDSDGGCDFVSFCNSATPPTCPAYTHCDDEPDAGKYSCDCNEGYTPTGVPGECNAHDYCSDSPPHCPSCTVCDDLPDAGSYECTPNEGYYLDAGSCALVNACGTLVCDTNASCVGTQCVCNADAGYHGSGTTCHDGYDRIALGGQHTCSITEDGALWCWGQQCQGQLGNGYAAPQCPSPNSAQSVACPAPVGTSLEWTQVAAGGAHTCAIQSSTTGGDTLWCWGENDSAQLGFSTVSGSNHSFNTDTPEQVGSATNWAKVAASNENTCAIDATGALYCWGDDTYGQLCTGGQPFTPTAGVSTGVTNIPVPVTAMTGAKWADVAMGDQHTCGLLTDGTLWCCGDDENGQIGTTAGDTMVSVSGFNKPLALSMTEVTNSHSTKWMAVGAGGGAGGLGHTCAVDVAGTAWCWGDNTYGELGNGGLGGQSNTPTLVDNSNTEMDMASWVSIQSGPQAAHTCGIRSDSTIWCWGLNESNGQLGIGSSAPYETVPVEVALSVEELGTFPENGFGVGTYFTCGLDAKGDAYCWGNNAYGQLGDCDFTLSVTPNETY